MSNEWFKKQLHEAGWYARSDLDPRLIDGLLADVLALVGERLTGPEMADHVQNFVPLGYDYPRRDPHPSPHAAAIAILAEVADTMLSTPGSES